MPTSRNTGSRRGSQELPAGRRPRVAGLRKRPQDDSASTASADAGTLTPAEPQPSAESAAAPGVAESKPGDDEVDTTAPDTTAPEKSTTDATTTDTAAGTPTSEVATPDSTKADTADADATDAEATTAEATERVRITDDTAAAEAADSEATRDVDASDVPASNAPASNVPASETAGSDADATQRLTGQDTSAAKPTAKPVVAGQRTQWAGSRAALIPAMVVLAVVCAGLAVWFRYEAVALGSDGPGANEALVEKGATAEVNGQMRSAVEQLFSYDFADTAKTEQAAKSLLTGDAIGKYNNLFATVKEQAPKQKLVVTTTVKASGVTQLQGDRAEVLLFVDQNAVRTDSGQSNVGPGQISVSAVKQGDQWKISSITPR